jgi:hypothetical protein
MIIFLSAVKILVGLILDATGKVPVEKSLVVSGAAKPSFVF